LGPQLQSLQVLGPSFSKEEIHHGNQGKKTSKDAQGQEAPRKVAELGTASEAEPAAPRRRLTHPQPLGPLVQDRRPFSMQAIDSSLSKEEIHDGNQSKKTSKDPQGQETPRKVGGLDTAAQPDQCTPRRRLRHQEAPVGTGPAPVPAGPEEPENFRDTHHQARWVLVSEFHVTERKL